MISCTRPSFHHHDAVGDQHRLVEVVGDEDDGLAGAGVNVEQFAPAWSRASARRARRTARPSAAPSDRSRARARCRRAASCRRRAGADGGCANPSRPTSSRYFSAVSRSVAAAHALHLQAEHHVLQGRQPGQQFGVLEHHAAVVAAALDLAAVDGDAAARSRDRAPWRRAAPWSCRSRTGRSARRSRRRAR